MLGLFRHPLAEKLAPLFKFKYLPALVKICPDVYYPAKHWAPLKIACLSSYLHTCFIPIQGSRKKKQRLNIYFIDLLANSGVNRIDHCKNCDSEKNSAACLRKRCRAREFYNDPFIGSPIVAAAAKTPFNKMYFVDKEAAECDALEKRLHFLRQTPEHSAINYSVIKGDCNGAVDSIFEDIGETALKFHSILAFVDNAGFNAKWDTIAKLASQYSDLIINFPTAEIKREFGAARSGRGHKELDLFFGEKNILELCNEDNCLEFYVNKLKSMGRPVQTVAIKADELSFHYHLIITVKKESPGFYKFLESIKKFESYNSKDIEAAIDILFGRATTLAKFGGAPLTYT